MAAASQRAIRLLAGANVAALGTLGAAIALKPDGDATTGGVVAQAEAVGRAARLAGTLAVVAADYKGVEWFSNETKDASASERLKKAMAEQELSGLEVERAKDAAAREAGVRRAAAAREAVLRESAAVAAEGSATTAERGTRAERRATSPPSASERRRVREDRAALRAARLLATARVHDGLCVLPRRRGPLVVGRRPRGRQGGARRRAGRGLRRLRARADREREFSSSPPRGLEGKGRRGESPASRSPRDERRRPGALRRGRGRLRQAVPGVSDAVGRRRDRAAPAARARLRRGGGELPALRQDVRAVAGRRRARGLRRGDVGARADDELGAGRQRHAEGRNPRRAGPRPDGRRGARVDGVRVSDVPRRPRALRPARGERARARVAGGPAAARSAGPRALPRTR